MSVAIESALRDLKESAGLDLAAVVSADGLVIESVNESHVDADAVATVAASGLLMMDSLGRELNQGPAQDVILEYEDNLVVLSPLGDDMVLVAVAIGGTNLGRIRLLVRRSLEHLRQVTR